MNESSAGAPTERFLLLPDHHDGETLVKSVLVPPSTMMGGAHRGGGGGGGARGRPKVISGQHYEGIGSRQALDKKVPSNPKYAGVSAKVQTGARWRDDITFTRPKRKNEFFGRVKAQLLVQILEENEDAEESLYNLGSGGGAAREVVVDAAATGGAASGRPYILLDMRSEDQYEQFHIRNAISFPLSFLSRSTNCFTAAVLPYINHPEHIVIVYCDDEKAGMQAASRLAEKNVDNCYLLSGGLQHFAVSYSSYVDGGMPAGYAAPVPKTARSSLMSGGSPARRKAPGGSASGRPGTGQSTMSAVESVRSMRR